MKFDNTIVTGTIFFILDPLLCLEFFQKLTVCWWVGIRKDFRVLLRPELLDFGLKLGHSWTKFVCFWAIQLNKSISDQEYWHCMPKIKTWSKLRTILSAFHKNFPTKLYQYQMGIKTHLNFQNLKQFALEKNPLYFKSLRIVEY